MLAASVTESQKVLEIVALWTYKVAKHEMPNSVQL